MAPRLLVIAFYFPPFKMVAARRWAKHLKYACRDGLDFYVLTRSFVDHEQSSWSKDTDAYKDRVFRLQFNKRPPYYKTRLPKGLLDKIRWKCSYWINTVLGPSEQELLGDESIGSEKLFLKEAIRLVEEKNISHIILTVGPHRFSVILPELKKRFPHLNIQIDYRDYWQDKEHLVNSELLEKERVVEDRVLASVDGIIVVNKEMETFFRKKMNDRVPVTVLPHCYDQDDFPEKASVSRSFDRAQPLRFIYGGALYAKMENYLELYRRFLEQLIAQGFRVTSDFYLPFRSYEKELVTLPGETRSMAVVGADQYFEEVKQSDVVLYFRPDWSPNAFSSKFFELIALKRPILYFGPASEVSEFLNTNNLGIHISGENFDQQLSRFVDLCAGKWQINTQYDLSKHSFAVQNRVFYHSIGFYQKELV